MLTLSRPGAGPEIPAIPGWSRPLKNIQKLNPSENQGGKGEQKRVLSPSLLATFLLAQSCNIGLRDLNFPYDTIICTLAPVLLPATHELIGLGRNIGWPEGAKAPVLAHVCVQRALLERFQCRSCLSQTRFENPILVLKERKIHTHST